MAVTFPILTRCLALCVCMCVLCVWERERKRLNILVVMCLLVENHTNVDHLPDPWRRERMIFANELYIHPFPSLGWSVWSCYFAKTNRGRKKRNCGCERAIFIIRVMYSLRIIVQCERERERDRHTDLFRI